MRRQIVVQSPALVNRRQPLIVERPSPAKAKEDKRGVGEVAGGTAAECAAIFCCCPCTVMNLLVLAVYKVPTGLCRKAWKKKKKRQKLKKKKVLLQQQHQQQQQQQSAKIGPPSMSDSSEIEKSDVDDAGSDRSTSTADDFESEMWDLFHGAGFWRSASQREELRNCK
ncbi:hypothetical protein U1Q18_025288 [Sarracenia purpurea var. burkii]